MKKTSKAKTHCGIPLSKTMMGITLVLSLGLLEVLNPLLAGAVGDNDPLWRRHSYEKKVIQVGNHMLQANGIQERIVFRVSRSAQPNAFASEDYGTVTVESALLRLIESDDELAAILGHEITHIIRRHVTKGEIKRGVVGGLIAGLYGFASTYGNNPWLLYNAGRDIEILTRPLNQSYELEADQMGLDLMVKAGYNPNAMLNIYGKFLGDGTKIWRTHPIGSKRIAILKNLIITKYPQYLNPPIAPPGIVPVIAGTLPHVPAGFAPPTSQQPIPSAVRSMLPEKPNTITGDGSQPVAMMVQPETTTTSLSSGNMPGTTPLEMHQNPRPVEEPSDNPGNSE